MAALMKMLQMIICRVTSLIDIDALHDARAVFLKPRVATQEPGRHEVTTGSRRLWKMTTSDTIMKFCKGNNGL